MSHFWKQVAYKFFESGSAAALSVGQFLKRLPATQKRCSCIDILSSAGQRYSSAALPKHSIVFRHSPRRILIHNIYIFILGYFIHGVES
jgi:hypothetical protein